MRGKVREMADAYKDYRITPAYAGKRGFYAMLYTGL